MRSVFSSASGPRRSLSRFLSPLALIALLLTVSGARASVALLLEQPYGELGRFNPTGHSAIYFDHVCAATPVQLRPCGPGELGVVISRYNGIGDYDWIAVPLVPYLYAVSSPAEVPSTIDRLSALRMRDLYRREHLEGIVPDTPTGGMPQGNWYELVGSAYDRTIYGFQIATTAEQDGQLIAYFNDRRNISVYNAAFRNCADFARVVVDHLYPHAVRRNFIADFGITTPKSVARGLTHYAHKHPETDLRVFKIPQVGGDLPRSAAVQGVAEGLLKRYGLPLVILSPHVTAVMLAAYVGRGRFDVPKHAPVLDLSALQRASSAAMSPTKESASAVLGPVEPPGVAATAFGGGSFSAEYTGELDDGVVETVPFLP